MFHETTFILWNKKVELVKWPLKSPSVISHYHKGFQKKNMNRKSKDLYLICITCRVICGLQLPIHSLSKQICGLHFLSTQNLFNVQKQSYLFSLLAISPPFSILENAQIASWLVQPCVFSGPTHSNYLTCPQYAAEPGCKIFLCLFCSCNCQGFLPGHRNFQSRLPMQFDYQHVKSQLI